MRSIEQSQEFQLARRVAALVVPGWRLLASAGVPPGALAIDLKKRAIEIGEHSSNDCLLAGTMFAVGHVRLQDSARFLELFGERLRTYSDSDELELLQKLSAQGALADKRAVEWAERALHIFFPALDCRAALLSYSWRRQDWLRYFSST